MEYESLVTWMFVLRLGFCGLDILLRLSQMSSGHVAIELCSWAFLDDRSGRTNQPANCLFAWTASLQGKT